MNNRDTKLIWESITGDVERGSVDKQVYVLADDRFVHGAYTTLKGAESARERIGRNFHTQEWATEIFPVLVDEDPKINSPLPTQKPQ